MWSSHSVVLMDHSLLFLSQYEAVCSNLTIARCTAILLKSNVCAICLSDCPSWYKLLELKRIELFTYFLEKVFNFRSNIAGARE